MLCNKDEHGGYLASGRPFERMVNLLTFFLL